MLMTREYKSSLPQAGVNQRDVTVTPSDHDVFNVGGCPELSSQLTGTEQEHSKPFEMDTKTEERGHYLSQLGRGTSERNNCGNVRRSYLHRLTLIIRKDADVLGELMMALPWVFMPQPASPQCKRYLFNFRLDCSEAGTFMGTHREFVCHCVPD